MKSLSLNLKNPSHFSSDSAGGQVPTIRTFKMAKIKDNALIPASYPLLLLYRDNTLFHRGYSEALYILWKHGIDIVSQFAVFPKEIAQVEAVAKLGEQLDLWEVRIEE